LLLLILECHLGRLAVQNLSPLTTAQRQGVLADVHDREPRLRRGAPTEAG